jgi:hypothetical protein
MAKRPPAPPKPVSRALDTPDAQRAKRQRDKEAELDRYIEQHQELYPPPSDEKRPPDEGRASDT